MVSAALAVVVAVSVRAQEPPPPPPYRSPLDAKISMEFPGGQLRDFFREISDKSNLEFTLVQGLGDCRVAAFLRDTTFREVLQMMLGTRQGLSYQQLGRSNHYTVARMRGGPQCPPTGTKMATGSCVSVGGKSGVACKDGSLASLAAILFEQSKGSFLVWNEAVSHPVSLKLRKATMENVAKKIKKDPSLDVTSTQSGKGYVFVVKAPIAETYQGSGPTDRIGGPKDRQGRRDEPPANPPFP